ncbi:Dual specificity protein phosphatase 23 [Clonorchis sinensis]|uniref:Dual specificity protein phosphatase 23 n=2 Tax=Clonorchis sinensis TaxID=79923 RepID=A0A8T1M5Y5_CLOSI|nr:Dual specificity protein phosphatase 23 [Clonorchis sinensis]GAA47165.1 dual specificity phosphatase [Clonorchis sinensis]
MWKSVFSCGDRGLLVRFLSAAPKMAREPMNFSWVSDSVAGFAFPYDKEEWEYLSNVAKLSHVITMCHESPHYATEYPNIKHHHLPVDDLSPANVSIIQKAMKIIQDAEAKEQKVGVHCQLGRGRAGTILACYLARKNGWDADTAIRELRRLRPKSIDVDQEQAILKYVQSIRS